jgi:hypothetical protein
MLAIEIIVNKAMANRIDDKSSTLARLNLLNALISVEEIVIP